jgi:hypothetical protein
MQVWIDQRRELCRGLDGWVQGDAKLAEEAGVWPEAGCDDDAVDVDAGRLAAQSRADADGAWAVL